ncbi:MAG: pyrrolysine--tRNA(Pyl) ligase large subunit [Desulfitobacterium hafniense]|nr:pyrrolysine--tRNA(Pyl) ligase large subunit [Desulfitobacterium hafniense]
MTVFLTQTQQQKLIELDALLDVKSISFDTIDERDSFFQKLEKSLVSKNRSRLLNLRDHSRRPVVNDLESKLVKRLNEEGFVQVSTPIILAKGTLDKMTINDQHPLSKQVFWLDDGRCLRPMLAPNLYYLLGVLERLWGNPVKIFEVGPCFRKESQGANHLNEFTMLNLVELGIPLGQQNSRLREFAQIVMSTVGIEGYELEVSQSEVYGETIDVVYEGTELGSGAYGPHELDFPWGIVDPWVGIGFGLERLAMILGGHRNIKRVGRSLAYLDGSRLNI